MDELPPGFLNYMKTPSVTPEGLFTVWNTLILGPVLGFVHKRHGVLPALPSAPQPDGQQAAISPPQPNYMLRGETHVQVAPPDFQGNAQDPQPNLVVAYEVHVQNIDVAPATSPC